MKNTALTNISIALLLVSVWASATAAAPLPAVADFRHEQVRLSQPARRIVCLIESALSGLYMLGAQDRVVGISTNIYQDELFRFYAAMDSRVAARELPVPGNWDFVNIESVIGLQPDLVILWASQTEAIDALSSRGIAVYGVELATFDDVFKEIRDLGILCGREKRAEELIGYAEDSLGQLTEWKRSKTAGAPPSVYFMWSQGPLETSGSPSTVNDLLDLAGARNVAGAIPQEHLVVNIEKLIAWQPQVIVMWRNPRLSTADIAAMPVWQTLPAVRNDRIHQMPSVFFCDLWTLKFIHAVKLIMSWCYPADISVPDMQAEKRNLLTALYGPETGARIPLDE